MINYKLNVLIDEIVKAGIKIIPEHIFLYENDKRGSIRVSMDFENRHECNKFFGLMGWEDNYYESPEELADKELLRSYSLSTCDDYDWVLNFESEKLDEMILVMQEWNSL